MRSRRLLARLPSRSAVDHSFFESGGEVYCLALYYRPYVDPDDVIRGSAGCFSYCVVASDGSDLDVVFGIPWVQLARVWPQALNEELGGAWELPLEEVLLALATHVYVRAPFQRALTGVEVGVCPEELEPPRPLPAEYGVGILDVTNGNLIWHPPTGRSWSD